MRKWICITSPAQKWLGFDQQIKNTTQDNFFFLDHIPDVAKVLNAPKESNNLNRHLLFTDYSSDVADESNEDRSQQLTFSLPYKRGKEGNEKNGLPP
jgi:hypothetical protein